MWQADHEIVIDAPPEVVWRVLIDLDRYPQWNTYARAAKGDVTRLNRIELDLANPEQPRVRMECGATVAEVNAVLERAGYALPFNVVLESVRFGGLIATGSHGSGWAHPTLSDLVHSIDILAGDGELRHFEAGITPDDVMSAARLNLGMFGLIVRMTLDIQRTWRVRASDQRVPIAEAMARLPELVTTHDNCDFFWCAIRNSGY